MSFEVTLTDDPSHVLDVAQGFLAADPVRNNVMLTLLNERVEKREPGRYWIVASDSTVCGVVFQSPTSFPLLMTDMSSAAIEATVEKLASTGVEVPGVSSGAQTSAAFAGQWAERSKTPVTPGFVGRQYECTIVVPPATAAAGEMRAVEPSDRDLFVEWGEQYSRETGDLPISAAELIDTAVRNRNMVAWHDDGPVSMSVYTEPVAGVSRIRAVYTPEQNRSRGYASALVAELTSQILRDGIRCTLFTDLANPISNSVYRKIGFEPVQEFLRFKFG